MFRVKHIAAVLLFCLVVPLGHANSIITNPGPGLVSSSIGTTTGGFDFTVGSASLLVSALGIWDQNQNGLTNSHTVGLWDNTGNLLAQVSTASGTVDPLTGAFRYVNLATPVTLNAGMTYVLAATYLNVDLDRVVVNINGNQAAFDPLVLAGNFRQELASGLVFPDANIPPGSVVGPNALFTPVATPETGPGLLFTALVLVALFVFRRRIATTA
jgi:MYXO-CTERM domain-containing protein